MRLCSRDTAYRGIDAGVLSTTLLPGGMNVLADRGLHPGKGEVNLLASPTIESAASMMNGKGEDADGILSMAMGGRLKFRGPAVMGTPARWMDG